MSLPVIEHATVALNENNRVVIRMDDGWVFYRLDLFPDGTPSEDIAYSRYGVFPPPENFEFSNIVVVAESEVPADQIFGNPNHETM